MAAEHLYIFARFRAKPGNQDAVAAALREIVPPTRAEAGCLGLNTFRATRDPQLFYLHSQWVDEAAFDYHASLPHTVKFIETVKPLIDHEFDLARTKLMD
ncbi:MAG: putative quinol monooxygenase [Candidatus Korobacteraceae bacterium]